MRILLDMNLSPRWVDYLREAGHQAVHWRDVGAPDAADRTIMEWAAGEQYVVFTHDLDFSALLAATQASSPSVIQLRAQDILPGTSGQVILNALDQFEEQLREGAIVSVDPEEARARLLPFDSE